MPLTFSIFSAMITTVQPSVYIFVPHYNNMQYIKSLTAKVDIYNQEISPHYSSKNKCSHNEPP